MRRTTLRLAALATCVWLLPEVAAAAPLARLAAGTAILDVGGARISLSARGHDPTTEEATGHVVNVWDSGIAYEVEVTCMAVVANRASIGGEITASDLFPELIGSGLVVVVVDNGEPGKGVDRLGHSLNVTPQPLPGSDCPFPQVLGEAFAIDNGNLQVLAR